MKISNFFLINLKFVVRFISGDVYLSENIERHIFCLNKFKKMNTMQISLSEVFHNLFTQIR